MATAAYQLEVLEEDGQVLWHLPVRPGATVILTYTNSLYNAPTEEFFTVTTRGFVLTDVRSTSDAVLEHNMLPGPYVKDGPYFVSATRVAVPSIVTRIGQTGQQRLIVGSRTLPLYDIGVGGQVTVVVQRIPLIRQIKQAVWRGRTP